MEAYRKFLKGLLVFSVIFTMGYGFYLIKSAIPDELHFTSNSTENVKLELSVPVMATIGTKPLNLNQQITVHTGETGSYEMKCSLFGVIPVKNVAVHVVNENNVKALGIPVGIYLETDGVMVLGSGQVSKENGELVEPAKEKVISGDYIEKVNGVSIDTKEELIEEIHNSKESAVLTIRRQGELVEVTVPIVESDSHEKKIGVWVRDDAQGIGTLTYMTKSGKFGGLGHGVNDVDTGTLMDLSMGELYETKIFDIHSGKAGKPGALEGMIYYNQTTKLGNIEKNGTCGIFGQADEKLKEEAEGEWLKVGYSWEVKKGPALIQCKLQDALKQYQVEIMQIQYGDNEKKQMVLKVTDPELIGKTGGIVQGMSGSPIIQDGKLIGAVTHVFVNDPTKGYGIFIENMLQH